MLAGEIFSSERPLFLVLPASQAYFLFPSGTIIFTILLFLFPTSLTFYAVFLALRTAANMVTMVFRAVIMGLHWVPSDKEVI